ncbi:hypothetical protein B0H17DRAFT_1304590 [Mycena rosella]|uniref:Uncharacterized protein n=1 Tax=Mycena rosella TaxID=1033263 RepID=A0AAD7GF98_MYCRO|nr:hypothetical protein B0H17DRAFT_1304590 [Mycena rosella]
MILAMGPLAPHYDEVKKDLHSLQRPNAGKGKTRLCIILPSVMQNLAGKICLTATFDKGDPADYPEIYREFIIPMAPNNNVNTRYSEPLHASPEWSFEEEQ